jgi:hypothetical protein
MTETLLDDGPDSAEWAWTELSRLVDPLAGNAAVRVRRYELPDHHPARVAGHPCDVLVLGADDVLRTA